MEKNISILTLAAVLLAGASAAGEFTRSKDMRFNHGKPVPFIQQKPFFELDFGQNPDCWDPAVRKNYQGLLKIDPMGMHHHEKCLVVTRKKENRATDTAWSIGTRSLPTQGSTNQSTW